MLQAKQTTATRAAAHDPATIVGHRAACVATRRTRLDLGERRTSANVWRAASSTRFRRRTRSAIELLAAAVVDVRAAVLAKLGACLGCAAAYIRNTSASTNVVPFARAAVDEETAAVADIGAAILAEPITRLGRAEGRPALVEPCAATIRRRAAACATDVDAAAAIADRAAVRVLLCATLGLAGALVLAAAEVGLAAPATIEEAPAPIVDRTTLCTCLGTGFGNAGVTRGTLQNAPAFVVERSALVFRAGGSANGPAAAVGSRERGGTVVAVDEEAATDP